jgi:hypothetical protein
MAFMSAATGFGQVKVAHTVDLAHLLHPVRIGVSFSAIGRSLLPKHIKISIKDGKRRGPRSGTLILEQNGKRLLGSN